MSLDPSPDDLADGLKAEARQLGFDMIGIAPAVAPPGYEHFRRWLDLDVDHVSAEGWLGADPLLAPLVAARPGLRFPRAVVGAETAVRIGGISVFASSTSCGTSTHTGPRGYVIASTHADSMAVGMAAWCVTVR